MDIDDTSQKYQGLMSSVRDIMMKNQNLYQQDLENKYKDYMPQPTQAEVDAQTAENQVDTPEPYAEPEDIDPDSVIDGASGFNGQD